MKTKLQAAQLACKNGIETIITNGKTPSSIYKILNGEQIGTSFSELN